MLCVMLQNLAGFGMDGVVVFLITFAELHRVFRNTVVYVLLSVVVTVPLAVLISFLLPVLGVGLYVAVWVLTPWQDGSIPLEQALGRGRGTTLT